MKIGNVHAHVNDVLMLEERRAFFRRPISFSPLSLSLSFYLLIYLCLSLSLVLILFICPTSFVFSFHVYWSPSSSERRRGRRLALFREEKFLTSPGALTTIFLTSPLSALRY